MSMSTVRLPKSQWALLSCPKLSKDLHSCNTSSQYNKIPQSLWHHGLALNYYISSFPLVHWRYYSLGLQIITLLFSHEDLFSLLLLLPLSFGIQSLFLKIRFQNILCLWSFCHMYLVWINTLAGYQHWWG